MSNSSIKKAVIPAAGFGTRMLPAAKAVPKELLPVLQQPVIHYVMEEAAEAGIEEVLLVTSRYKGAIKDYFSPHAELEQRLKTGGRSHLLESLHALTKRLKISYIQQAQQRGLGDAVNQARAYAGDAPFACLLGDAIFCRMGATRQIVEAYQRLGTPIIALQEVDAHKVDRYGIAAGREVEPGIWLLSDLVEKPRPQNAPSRLAIAARYILTPDIFDCLDRTPHGSGGEIQLTDALRLLMQQRAIHGVVLEQKRYDIGNVATWLQTNLVFARNDAALWKELAPLLRALLEQAD